MEYVWEYIVVVTIAMWNLIKGVNMIILTLIGIVFTSGWIMLINLAVRNEVIFEDKQIEEMREFRERGRK